MIDDAMSRHRGSLDNQQLPTGNKTAVIDANASCVVQPDPNPLHYFCSSRANSKLGIFDIDQQRSQSVNFTQNSSQQISE